MTEQKRYVPENKPYNELEYQYMLTQPAWGRESTEGLYVKLINSNILNENERSEAYSLWERLAYYTRDIRLGNLSSQEMKYTQFWIDIAGDLLDYGYKRSFMSAMSRAITVLELSQSKQGFLRKRQGTVTSEQMIQQHTQSGSTNKTLFGNKKRGDSYG